jgi:hypothetical protein
VNSKDLINYNHCLENACEVAKHAGENYDGTEIVLDGELLDCSADHAADGDTIPDDTIFTISFDMWFIEKPIAIESNIDHRTLVIEIAASELIKYDALFFEKGEHWGVDIGNVIKCEQEAFPLTSKFVSEELVDLFCGELHDHFDGSLSEYGNEFEAGEYDHLHDKVLAMVKEAIKQEDENEKSASETIHKTAHPKGGSQTGGLGILNADELKELLE